MGNFQIQQLPRILRTKQIASLPEQIVSTLVQENLIKTEVLEREQAELKRKQKEEQKAKEQAELKRKQEEEQKAKEQAELERKQEKERKAKIQEELYRKQNDKNKKNELVFEHKIQNEYHNIETKPKFDFISGRKKMYVLSSVLIIFGIISLLIRGLDLGVEFTGGREYTIKIDQIVKESEIKNALAGILWGEPVVEVFENINEIKITTNG